MLEADMRRRGRLLKGEAALATLGGEKGPRGHDRGPWREIRWPDGPAPRRRRAPQPSALWMRERGAEAATTEMGRMGAEDPSRIPGRDPDVTPGRSFPAARQRLGGSSTPRAPSTLGRRRSR